MLELRGGVGDALLLRLRLWLWLPVRRLRHLHSLLELCDLCLELQRSNRVGACLHMLTCPCVQSSPEPRAAPPLCSRESQSRECCLSPCMPPSAAEP